MTDKQKKPPLPDETKDEGDSAPDVPTPTKPKRGSGQKDEDAAVQASLTPAQAQPDQPQSDEVTPTDEDALASVRRALVEEEQAKPERKWRKIFRRKKKSEETDESKLALEGRIAKSVPETVDDSRSGERAEVPPEERLRRVTGPLKERKVTGPLSERRATGPLSTPEAAVETSPETPVKEDILKSILGIDTSSLPPESQEAVAPPPAEETAVIDKARRREILRPERDEEEVEDIEAIREEALKDYSDEPLQPEGELAPTVTQRTRRLFGGMKPIEKIVLIGIVAVMVVAGLFGVGLAVNSLQPPPATPTVDPSIPFPMGVTLPGGWSFQLNKGKVVDGRWDPTGAEWLEGTELCKWVALPWSRQLEAVMRTLKADDPIELKMSNADDLTFKVQSLRKVAVDEVAALEQQAPCLLLILVNKDEDTRLVLTAVP